MNAYKTTKKRVYTLLLLSALLFPALLVVLPNVEAETGSSPWRPFNANTIYNTKIPSDVEYRADSQAMLGVSCTTPLALRVGDVWMSAIYDVDTSTGEGVVWEWRYLVCEPYYGLNVPVPIGVDWAPSADGHALILDWYTYYQYDLFQFNGYVASELWRYDDFQEGYGYGIPKQQVGIGSSGIAMIGGQVRPEEIIAGVIPHMVALNVGNSHAYYHCYPPAAHTRGWESYPSIPIGCRIQLNPDYDISGLTSVGQIFAKAMQDYGGFPRDQTGGTGWQIITEFDGSVQHRLGLSWWDLGMSTTLLNSIPLSEYRVLEYGQQDANGNWVSGYLFPDGGPVPPPEDPYPYTIVHVSDTQYLSRDYPDRTDALFEYLETQKGEGAWNIENIIFSGDFVQDYYSTTQWNNIIDSMGRTTIGISEVAGNHDNNYGANWDYYDTYIGSEFRHYWERVRDFLILNIGWVSGNTLSSSQIQFFQDAIDANPDAKYAIINAHYHINLDSSLSTLGNQIVNNNLFIQGATNIVMCGHMHGNARNNRTVGTSTLYEFLTNYQEQAGYACASVFTVYASYFTERILRVRPEPVAWLSSEVIYPLTTGVTPPNPPTAGTPHVSTTGAGMTANISAIASCDTDYTNPTIYLDSWIVEHNSTGTPQNVTGNFVGTPAPQKAIILTFDDNDPSLGTTAIQYMNNYNFRGVGFINCTKNQAQDVAQNMSNAGWEIGSHTMTHPPLGSSTEAELDYEIRDSKTWLLNNVIGAYPVIMFAYPYGEGNDISAVRTRVEANYHLARDAAGVSGTIWDGSQDYAILPYAVRDSEYASTIADALSDLSSATHGYVVLMFHEVKASPSAWGITPANFDYVLNQISQSGYPVRTFKNVYLQGGQTEMWSFMLQLNSTVGEEIYFTAWVNDTQGVWSQSSTTTITTTEPYLESDPPWVGNLATNSTVCDADAEITAAATDDLGLSGYFFSTNNGSGTFVNQSWSDPWGGNPTSASLSQVYRLNATNQTLITVRVYVNDTHDQWSWNELQFTVYDTSPPPQIPNAGFPQTNCTYAGGSANISSVSSCDSSRTLSHAVLRHNNTGSYGNYTYAFSGSSTSETWYFTMTLDSTINGTVVFTAWANDSAGVWSPASSNLTLTLQQTPPLSALPFVNNLVANSTTIAMSCNITMVATDDVGLSHWIIGTNNGSATWTNQTWQAFSGTPTTASFSYTYTELNNTIGTLIRFQVWVNDTHNQVSTNELYLNTTDYTLPTVYLSHDTNVWRQNNTYYVSVTDDYGVVGLYFSINSTGTWINSTYQTAAGTPTTWSWNSSALNSTFNFIGGEYGSTITYKVYVNNTMGKWRESHRIYVVSLGYKLTWTIRTQDSATNIERYMTWTLYNGSQPVNYTENMRTLWGGNYTLRIYYKGDWMRTVAFNITTSDVSTTITLYAHRMTNLAGFIVANASATFTLIRQQVDDIEFTATGSSGPYLLKVDCPAGEPTLVTRNGVAYTNWTYNASTGVVDIVAASLSTWRIIIGNFEGEVAGRTTSNNAQFGLSSSLTFYQMSINETHFWMDQSYTSGYLTRYCIYVISPDNVQFTVNTWFPTRDSFGAATATLTLTSPTSTNVRFALYSPNLISAWSSGTTTYSFVDANNTLLMTGNTDTSSFITIHVNVTQTRLNQIQPQNVAVTITDMDAGNWVVCESNYYTFRATYWDGNGYANLDEMKIAFRACAKDDGSNVWVNATYDETDEDWVLDSGSSLVRIRSGTATVLDVNTYRLDFLLFFTGDCMDLEDLDIWMRCEDDWGGSDGWEIRQTDYFCIYNLGGVVNTTTNGVAGRLEGGDWLNLYASDPRGWGGLDYIELSPTDDSYVASGGYGGITHGTLPMLLVGNYTVFDAATWLKFNLTSVDDTKTVASAQLLLYCSLWGWGSPSSFNVDVFWSANDSWSEASITWNNQPSTNGSALDTQTIGGFGFWYNWTVTSQVQTELSGDEVISFKAINQSNVNYWAQFNSKESTNSTFWPILRVNYQTTPYTGGNSWARAEQTWRNLQLVDMLLALDPLGNSTITTTAAGGMSPTCQEDSNELEFHGYWSFGVDYCLNGTWVEGWYCRLELVRNDYTGSMVGGADHITIFNCSWYHRGEFVKRDYVGAWYEGWGSESEKNVVRLNIKLWYNKANFSSWVGGWVTPMYYTMKAGNWIWDSYVPLLSFNPNSSYAIHASHPDQDDWEGPTKPCVDSFFFDRLYGAGSYGDQSNIVYAPEVEMSRLWVRVERDSDEGGWINKIEFAEKVDYTFGREMVGVDTPPYFEPQVPHIQSWGFLSALGNMFAQIGKAISDTMGTGLLRLWETFAGFMDTLFAWAGYPGAFTAFLAVINTFVTWFSDSFTYLAQLLVIGFSFVTVTMSKLLGFMSQVVTQWVSVAQQFFLFLDGAYTSGVHIWTDLGIPYFIMIGAILYPIFVLTIWEEKGFDAMLSHLKMVMDIFAFFVRGFLSIVQFTINLIISIIEALPIVE